MRYPYTLPDLEARFLPDENWQMDDFINPETGHKIHYNFALIQNPVGSVICLPGLSEFGEKYIETAKFFNAKGYNFYVIDWAYQGRSTRAGDNPHKRLSDGYDKDISDLDYFINDVIKTNTPLYMLGHSMGGHLGLRYLATQSHEIQAASFSAPMVGIHDLKYFPPCLRFLFKPLSARYIPGGKDWHEAGRKNDGTDIFSSDLLRDQVHNAWSLINPDLQLGSATFKWIIDSLKSIAFLKRKGTLDKITIPVLLAVAEKEMLVDNCAIKKAGKIIKHTKIIELKNSKHEILMETDDIRDRFLRETLEIFNSSK